MYWHCSQHSCCCADRWQHCCTTGAHHPLKANPPPRAQFMALRAAPEPIEAGQASPSTMVEPGMQELPPWSRAGGRGKAHGLQAAGYRGSLQSVCGTGHKGMVPTRHSGILAIWLVGCSVTLPNHMLLPSPGCCALLQWAPLVSSWEACLSPGRWWGGPSMGTWRHAGSTSRTLRALTG